MKTTKEFENYLQNNTDVKFEHSVNENLILVDVIDNKLEQMSLKRGDIARELFDDDANIYKYLRGDRRFSRDNLLKVLIYLKFSINDVQSILKANKYPIIYAKDKRDKIIYYGIHNKMSTYDIDKLLASEGVHKL